MLDSSLAKLYGVETKRINEAVKNNPIKFPERFSWKLTIEEYHELRTKFSTTNFSSMSRTMPRVFTEQGVAMLATILKSKTAVKISVKIMDAFVSMRHYIDNNEYRLSNIETKIIDHDNSIQFLMETFDVFDKKKRLNEVYFNGQIFDAYSKILEIFHEAKKQIIIVDSYADYTLLNMIKKLNIDVIIITKKNNLLTNQDILKYNKQYHNLQVIYDNTFHDRYFILDYHIVYHCGASINRIGYRTFSINLIRDEIVLEMLKNKIYEMM